MDYFRCMKILMVCLGNICRSPLAEGILKHKVLEKNLNWKVDSAGTSGWHAGELPDKRSIAVANAHGIDIIDQRSRPFRAYDLEEFDIIYAMDASNYRDILKHAKSDPERNKVKMIMNELEPGMNITVPDPYFGEHGFENVYQMLDKVCDAIIQNYATDYTD